MIAPMRSLGILLVLAGLSPVLVTAFVMVKAFNNQTPVDPQLIHRAMTLTFAGMPVAFLGLVLLILAFRRKRASRTGN